MTNNENVRKRLAQLIAGRGVSYAGISDMLGRNSAYIQQFIKRGTPSRLAERDRHMLAKFFGVAEDSLRNSDDISIQNGGVALQSGSDKGNSLRAIPKLSVSASAGPGHLADAELVECDLAFDEQWLRRQGLGNAALNMICVEGDSMEPTLCDGDDIMVAMLSGNIPRRDSVYVLRIDDALMVKRLAFQPDGTVTVISDNLSYPAKEGVQMDAITIVGRVVWAGRRL